MRVVPVIDLMRGQVVRGVGGRRDEYRPIESILAADAQPRTVGQAFADAGFREVYVADLDAIGGGKPAWSVYEELMSCGLDLCVDAGVSDLERARAIAQFSSAGQQIGGIVAGLESLRSVSQLGKMCDDIGRDRVVFSLDLKNGSPITDLPELRALSAKQVAKVAIDFGVQRMIVLDLASVGMGQGVGTELLCREFRALDSELEITAGGGVRGWDDLHSLQAAGCNAALVASALHDGRLPAHECAALR